MFYTMLISIISDLFARLQHNITSQKHNTIFPNNLHKQKGNSLYRNPFRSSPAATALHNSDWPPSWVPRSERFSGWCTVLDELVTSRRTVRQPRWWSRTEALRRRSPAGSDLTRTREWSSTRRGSSQTASPQRGDVRPMRERWAGQAGRQLASECSYTLVSRRLQGTHGRCSCNFKIDCSVNF